MPSTVAAVLAHRLAPGADNYLLATSLAPDRGHRRLLDLLGREPLTDWSITGHSGVGALLVVPALCAAAQAFDDIDRAPSGPRRSASAISTWDAKLLVSRVALDRYCRARRERPTAGCDSNSAKPTQVIARRLGRCRPPAFCLPRMSQRRRGITDSSTLPRAVTRRRFRQERHI